VGWVKNVTNMDSSSEPREADVKNPSGSRGLPGVPHWNLIPN
jgi:hypothetical protein